MSTAPKLSEANDCLAIEGLERNIIEIAEELLPALIEKIEETKFEVAQKMTIHVKFIPGKNDAIPAINIKGGLAFSTTEASRATNMGASGQLVLFGS